MSARTAPAEPPFADEIQEQLTKLMPPGVAPLVLFTTLARDPRLFKKFMAAGLLDRGNLTIRQREIVIGRITARSGSEYEWGVHIALFAERAGLGEDQIVALTKENAEGAAWSGEDLALIAACDELHQTCTLSDDAWAALRRTLSEEAIVEVLMLAGFYRTVSYLTNALQLPLEPFGRRFPA